jgi:hypothetical protein
MRVGFLLQREELRREWRKLCKEELRKLYSSEIIISVKTDKELHFAGDTFGKARG